MQWMESYCNMYKGLNTKFTMGSSKLGIKPGFFLSARKMRFPKMNLIRIGCYRISEWFGSEGNLKPIQFYPCHGQGHLPLSQVPPSPIQPGLEHCQGSRGSNSFCGQPVMSLGLPCLTHCSLWLSLRVDSPGTQAAELCSQCPVGFGVWVGQSRGSQAPQLQFKSVILGFYEEYLAISCKTTLRPWRTAGHHNWLVWACPT